MPLRSLTLAEKRATVRALALVAWADRVLTREERGVVSRYAAQLTGLDAGAVETGLEEGKNLLKYGADIGAALRDLSGISTEEGLALLRHCYDVGASDRRLNDAELKMIALVAAQFVPRHRVVHVLRWLRTRRELLRLEGALSGVPGAAAPVKAPKAAGKRKAAAKQPKQPKKPKPAAKGTKRRTAAKKSPAKRRSAGR